MPDIVLLRDCTPLADRVAAELLRGADTQPRDLSAMAVVLPTTGAIRRLRAALATASGGRLLPPRMVLPMGLLAAAGSGRAAARTDCLRAWADVISESSADDCPQLLSGFADHATPGTALKIAESLQTVCALLAEAGLRPSSPDLAAASPQSDLRWAEIALLHERYLRRLAGVQLSDPNEIMLAAIGRGAAPDGIQRICLAAVPDLNLAVQRFLERVEAAGVRVTVLVDAPGGVAEGLDPWGRPQVAHWAGVRLPLPIESVHVFSNAGVEADAVAAMLGGASLCVADPASVRAQHRAFTARGIAAFDPAGEPLAHAECAVVASRWIGFCRSGRLGDLRALIEKPSFLQVLCAESGLAPSQALATLDAIRTDHLLDSLDDAVEFFAGGDGPAAAFVAAVAALRNRFPCEDSLAKLPALLARTGAHGQAAEALAALLHALLDSPLPGAATPELLDRELARIAVYPPHADTAVELSGWLEAPWLPAGPLVLSGCVEGALPASMHGHPFVPDGLRAALGLQTNAERYARDIFLLRNLLATRKAAEVRLTLSRIGPDGDPTKPSRLLFRCNDAELPERVQRLFAPCADAVRPPARESAWLLNVPQAEPRRSLAVTAFGSYLDCPLRFYLRNVLRLEAFEPGKAEMDAKDFGIILHRIVEGFSLDPDLREATEPGSIEGFLVAELDRVLAEMFGRHLSLPVRVQRESLRARLRAFARLQAAERRAGWRIVEAEVPFSAGETLSLAGLDVIARIDRVEVHQATGRRRVLDYKTYRSAKNHSPGQVHLGTAGTDPGFEEALVEHDGKTKRWSQLQLPLYRALAQVRWPGDAEPPIVGYALLPERTEETAIVEFPLDEDLFRSAMRCAEAIASRVARGIFWPPREVRWDDFETLFADGDPAGILSGESLQFLQGSAPTAP